MQFRRQRPRMEASFNLTPLIDVVFLLLIFFMVSTSFATIRQGIRVNLPTTSTAQEKIEQNIIISITRDDRIYLGKSWVKKGDLVPLLRRELKARGDLVIINADRDTRHGRVVEVMDLAKQAGATRLGILTSQKMEERGE